MNSTAQYLMYLSELKKGGGGGGGDDKYKQMLGKLLDKSVKDLEIPDGVLAIGSYACYQCGSLENVKFSDSVATIYNYAFQDCVKLALIDLPNVSSIGTVSFSGCTNLKTIILRFPYASCNLISTSAFSGTPFASNGSGGKLYVPQNLISEYQNASNWSTIIGYANNQILAIEGSEYE